MKVHLSKSLVLTLASALVVLAGVGDKVSGDDAVFTLIYLGPVALAAWNAGRTEGMLVAVLAALTSHLANRGHFPPLSAAVQFWNLATELGVFTSTVGLLGALKQRLEFESERALVDPLTGLKNRRAFEEAALVEIDRARRYGRPFTVALIDLDDFKRVNDTLGHQAGDQVLVAVSSTLRRLLRSVDIVARLGGDEFALLLPETALSEAATVFRDLLNEVPSRMQERGWTVGLSVGAVTFDAPPGTLDAALNAVDQLLYEVKDSGKGGVRLSAWPSGS